MENKIVCTRESSKLKINAIRKPSTPNPEINASASKMITAFITSKNKPRVIMVTGNVNNTNIGFTIRLSIARTMATIIAVT